MLTKSLSTSRISTMFKLKGGAALSITSTTARGYARQPPAPRATSTPESRSPSKNSKASDDSNEGTESSEYNLVDTDPTSTTPPYDHPRSSGKQLRYGGKECISPPEFRTHKAGVGRRTDDTAKYERLEKCLRKKKVSQSFGRIVKENDFRASIFAERRITLIPASLIIVCSVLNQCLPQFILLLEGDKHRSPTSVAPLRGLNQLVCSFHITRARWPTS